MWKKYDSFRRTLNQQIKCIHFLPIKKVRKGEILFSYDKKKNEKKSIIGVDNSMQQQYGLQKDTGNISEVILPLKFADTDVCRQTLVQHWFC